MSKKLSWCATLHGIAVPKQAIGRKAAKVVAH
jgi:hypothetical protein